jgi:hypothetical protein
MIITTVPASLPVLGTHRDSMLWSDQQWQKLMAGIALLGRITSITSLTEDHVSSKQYRPGERAAWHIFISGGSRIIRWLLI